MESTGTPRSTTSTLRFAMYLATVPPPPPSTLPSSPVCQSTLAPSSTAPDLGHKLGGSVGGIRFAAVAGVFGDDHPPFKKQELPASYAPA